MEQVEQTERLVSERIIILILPFYLKFYFTKTTLTAYISTSYQKYLSVPFLGKMEQKVPKSDIRQNADFFAFGSSFFAFHSPFLGRKRQQKNERLFLLNI
jgi:hypothetical protein